MRDSLRLHRQLERLGLSEQEASIFITLLEGPKTPVEVSRITGIARSNVYRIVDKLFDLGILREHTDDQDKLLAAADPDALELLVITQEEQAKQRRGQFEQLLPMLKSFTKRDDTSNIKTYRGVSGLKQMLWNELQCKGELLMFSSGPLERGISAFWADKYRAEAIRRGIVQKVIENPQNDAITLAQRVDYKPHYIPRYISPKILSIHPQIAIHDAAVFIYNPWDEDAKLGAEINNPFLAAFMRQIFEHYWALASPDPNAAMANDA